MPDHTPPDGAAPDAAAATVTITYDTGTAVASADCVIYDAVDIEFIAWAGIVTRLRNAAANNDTPEAETND